MNTPAWEDMNMTEEYFERTKYYQEIYGKNTILLMQSGAFYEVYGHKNLSEIEYKGSLIQDFSRICDMSISHKKIKYGKEELYMAGFRDYSIEKYVSKLVEKNFTVVVFSQEDKMQETGAQKKVRVLDGIYSPGTHVSYDVETETQWSNHLMCIWIHPFKKTVNVGISIINIFTGKSYLLEHTLPPGKIQNTSFDELDKCICIYRPMEVIYICDDPSILPNIHSLSNKDIYIHVLHTKISYISNASDQSYIHHILSKYFGSKCWTQCAEFSYYELATQCFCVITHFLEEHNPNLCKHIQFPHWENKRNNMLLANHTLEQLNILDVGKENGNLSSVHAWTNKCISVMGKRLFLEILTHPVFDDNLLQKEYDAIEKMSQSGMVDFIREQLKFVYDIQSLSRQLMNNKLYPSGLFKLFSSIEKIEQIFICFAETSWMYDYLEINSWSILQDKINTFLCFLRERVHIEICANVSNLIQVDNPIVKKGFYNDLDNLYESYEKNHNQILTIQNFLEKQINPTSKPGEYIKYNSTEKNCVRLQITKTRSNVLQQKMKNHSEKIILDYGIEFFWKDVQFVSSNKTNLEIRFPLCDEVCKNLGSFQSQLNKMTQEVYLSILKKIENDFIETIEMCGISIAKLDVLTNKTYIMDKYNYCKPEIDSSATKSYVHAHKLRHVLIERINQEELYVPNTVKIGGSEDLNGMLLFGTNTVGKTSMMRALGISIIMAQAGMYVPCSKFVFKPYESLFSRILNQDNLFKGLSTFGVEMSELRIILQYANKNSLVLGDELCSGTETVSALSIMMSSLIHLHKIKCSFMFTTHFHEIVDFSEMNDLKDKVKCFHLAISYDKNKGCIVYDRTLREGSGPRSYGLEICESLFMDKQFLEDAYNIRKKHFPEYEGSLNLSKSKYNAKKIKGNCECCGKTSDDIHHIKEQHLANQNGFIDSFHKNHPANLMAICKSCHQKFH